jgi:hypothetical protein
VPDRSEWEGCLPRFREENWEMPVEFLLDFHECILKLKVIHEDVIIKLFTYSLDGAARDWCRSLPVAYITSLRNFHAAFRLFCKETFETDFLYQECCYEFDLLSKESNSHKEYVAVEDTFHNDQEDDDLQSDSHDVYIFDIVSNVSIVLSCHENQIVSFEYSNDNEQIDISTCDSFESKPHEYNEGDKEGLYEHNWSNKFLQQLLPEINILSSFLNLDLQKILNNL